MSNTGSREPSERHLPAVLRSRRALEAKGISFLARDAKPPDELPILHDGATFNMAQGVSWMDPTTFAVGRWDGTLSLFRFNTSPTAGPIVTTAASSPANEGVQMIVCLAPGVFVTSKDDRSLAVWNCADGTWENLQTLAPANYDPHLGVANSGDVLDVDGTRLLVVGHASGHLSIWRWLQGAHRLEQERCVDIRAERPTNPWGLQNVRGVVAFPFARQPTVVAGSEAGRVCVLDAQKGTVLNAITYNPGAERGINSLALDGTALLVANCAVGADDSNLWSYEIDLTTFAISLRDRTRLVVSPSAPQVFNFCTIWGRFSGGRCFFASTEEGALWMGTVDAGGRIAVIGYRRVTSPLGAALAYNRSGKLVLVAHDLHEYRTGAECGDSP